MIELRYDLRQIRQRYDERTVLDLPALQIHAGEIFAIVGPNGSGKSTLVRLLGLLEAPTGGSLTLHLEGSAYTCDTAPIQVRRQIATVFQTPVLLSRSVRANVAYSLHIRRNGNTKRGINAQVEEVLEQVQMTPFAHKHIKTLSGGELQRVAIARALVWRPRILLLDEPTAHLDPYNVQLIESLLRDQNERFQTTVVLVTHNILQAKRLATRVAFLFNSQLIEVAPTEQFFTAPADPRTRAFLSGELVC